MPVTVPNRFPRRRAWLALLALGLLPGCGGEPGAEAPPADVSSGGAEESLPHRSTYRQLSDAELREKLSDLEYRVTRENATERAFANRYWDNKKEGIYVDVISGQPLFSSKDKFESGTGWPSFTRPLNEQEVVLVEDDSHGMLRAEVRSKTGDAHLGHVFDDGPPPSGMRYCMNSAALRFIPKEKLDELGYGEFRALFEEPVSAPKTVPLQPPPGIETP